MTLEPARPEAKGGMPGTQSAATPRARNEPISGKPRCVYSTLLVVFSLSIREPARTVRNFPPPRSSLLVMWRQVIKN